MLKLEVQVRAPTGFALLRCRTALEDSICVWMPQAQVTALQEEAKGLETGKEVGSLSLTLAALAVATEEWQLGSQDGWYCHKHKRAQALVKLSNRC